MDERDDTAVPSGDMRTVRIEIKTIHDAVIEIGGVDVARCLMGFSLEHHVGETPRLALYVAPRSVHLGSAIQVEVLKAILEVTSADKVGSHE